MRRNRFEMKIAVLKSCLVPQKITHIMYESNVNCNILKEILESLLEKNLLIVKQDKTRKYYQITGEGLSLLEIWEAVTSILSD
jgi:predicted transcriptional regulator